MQSLPTPFKYPQATLYSLAGPLTDLCDSETYIPVVNGRIQIQTKHLRALFLRLTCDQLEGGVVWSTKKITLLTLSAASVAVSFIAPWTIMMPLVFYVGYRMYKVCLIRQLLDQHIDPFEQRDYLSAPAPLLSQRVPAIADLNALLRDTIGLRNRALYLSSGSTRLTLPQTDHDQIMQFTPDLMRHSADSRIRAHVFDLLEKLHSANRPEFHAMMIDVLKRVTNPGLQLAILSAVLLYPTPNQQMDYLQSISSVIRKTQDEGSIRELIDILLALGQQVRGELTRLILGLFNEARGDQGVIHKIVTSIKSLRLAGESARIPDESIPLLYRLLTDVLPQLKDNGLDRIVLRDFINRSLADQTHYLESIRNLIERCTDSSIRMQVVREFAVVPIDQHLEYIEVMTGPLRDLDGLGVSDHLRVMPPVDCISAMRYLIPLFQESQSRTFKTNLSQIFVKAPKEMWPDLNVMMGFLFKQAEGTHVKEEITKLLGSLLAGQDFRAFNFRFAKTEERLLYLLLTDVIPTLKTYGVKRAVFTHFLRFDDTNRENYIRYIIPVLQLLGHSSFEEQLAFTVATARPIHWQALHPMMVSLFDRHKDNLTLKENIAIIMDILLRSEGIDSRSEASGLLKKINQLDPELFDILITQVLTKFCDSQRAPELFLQRLLNDYDRQGVEFARQTIGLMQQLPIFQAIDALREILSRQPREKQAEWNERMGVLFALSGDDEKRKMQITFLMNKLLSCPTSSPLENGVFDHLSRLEPELLFHLMTEVFTHFTDPHEMLKVLKTLLVMPKAHRDELVRKINPLAQQLSDHAAIENLWKVFLSQPKEAWFEWNERIGVLFGMADDQRRKAEIANWMQLFVILPPASRDRIITDYFIPEIEFPGIRTADLHGTPSQMLTYLFQQNPGLRWSTIEFAAQQYKNLTSRFAVDFWVQQMNGPYRVNFLYHGNNLHWRILHTHAASNSTASKSPYTIYERLIAASESHPPIETPWAEIEGLRVRFNVAQMQTTVQKTIPRAQVMEKLAGRELPNPPFAALADSMQARIDLMTPADRQACLAHLHEQDSLDRLCTNLKDGFFAELFSSALPDEVPIQRAYPFAIVGYILAQSNNPPEAGRLSEQEYVLLAFSSSVQNCSKGKLEGLIGFYNLLDKPSQYAIGPAEAEPIKQLAVDIEYQIRRLMGEDFSGHNHMMREMTSTAADRDVSQLAHQSIYLKNMLGVHLGLRDAVEFDVYSECISSTLSEKNLNKLAEIFFRHFTVDRVIEKVKQYYAAQVKEGGAPDMALYNASNDWLQLEGDKLTDAWDIEVVPIVPTTIGAIGILHKLGILEVEEAGA